MPKIAPIAASVAAIVTHFSVYYGGLTPYTEGGVRNPGVAATIAIVTSVVVGFGLYWLKRKD